jgi:hypothetical protein
VSTSFSPQAGGISPSYGQFSVVLTYIVPPCQHMIDCGVCCIYYVAMSSRICARGSKRFVLECPRKSRVVRTFAPLKGSFLHYFLDLVVPPSKDAVCNAPNAREPACQQDVLGQSFTGISRM